MWVLSTKLSFLPWVGTRVPLDAHWQLRENSLLWVTCILQKALLLCWIPRHSVRPLALEKRGRLVAQQCATVSPPYVNKSSIFFFLNLDCSSIPPLFYLPLHWGTGFLRKARDVIYTQRRKRILIQWLFFYSSVLLNIYKLFLDQTLGLKFYVVLWEIPRAAFSAMSFLKPQEQLSPWTGMNRL